MFARLSSALLLVFIASPVSAESWKFDMGGPGMPLMDGYTAVSKDMIYTSERGFGWAEAAGEEFDRADAVYPRFGTRYTRAQVVEPADALLIDGVASTDDLVFRLDLPNGRYWVKALAGDLGQPTFKTALSANGELISNKIDAYSRRDRGTFNNPAIAGGVFRSRFLVEVADGSLELRFHKAEGRSNPYEEIGMPAPQTLGRGGEGGAADHPDDLMPFTRNAVLGVEIHRHRALHRHVPFHMEDGRLIDGTGRAAGLVGMFNEKRFDEALEVVRAHAASQDPVAVACMKLWLAGRPEVADPYTLVSEARALLEDHLKDNPGDSSALDLHLSARLFDDAIKFRFQRFDEVGVENMRSLEGVWIADNFLRNLTEDDPLYLTAQLEIARLGAGADPNGHNESSYQAFKIFFDMQKEFPDNQYVAMYLRGIESIEQRGAGRTVRMLNTPEEVAESRARLRAMDVPRKYDWGYEGAPEWAVMVRDGLGWATDIVEWWVLHRQHEDGSLNRKGWSDDVEILRGWGPLAAIGHSPVILHGATKLAEGAWNTPMMNREWGIEDGRADVEHITEMAGDTIPPMIYLNFGDPIYIERAMRTMRKVRDFFTGYNKDGDRLFKSVNVGVDYIDPDPRMAMDTTYSHRLGLTGLLMMWYNRNPEVVRVMDEWASSWLKYAKTTLQGKPEGVMPFSIGFDSGKICFPEYDEWWKTEYVEPPLHRIGFIRLNYVHNLCLELFNIRREPRFLAAIEAAYGLIEKHGNALPDDPAIGSPEWVAMCLRLWNGDFAPILAKHRMLTGDTRFDQFIYENAGGAIEIYGTLLHFMDGPYMRYLSSGDKGYVIDGNKGFIRLLDARGFPMVTQEVVMTDRAGLGFGVEHAPIGPMTGDVRGWGGSIPFYAVTWRGIGRHLAALVTPDASNDRLKILLYNFNPEPLEVEMLLWRLDVGGEYILTMGPDADGDDEADAIEFEKTFVHAHRGDAVKYVIPSRQTQVLEIRQTKAGHNNFDVPDLAVVAREITVKEDAVEVVVHNIGNKDCGEFTVAVFEGEGIEGRRLGSATVASLPAPNDLIPQMTTVSIPAGEGNLKGAVITVAVDPDDNIYELTEVNNVATLGP